MSTKSRKLARKLRGSKEYRDAFVGSQFSIGLPFQIRALRKQMGWSQLQLAKESKMAQPTISSMENAGYDSFTLSTLKKIASAFDVGIMVRFVPFGDLVKWADTFSPDTFAVPNAESDPILNREDIEPSRDISSLLRLVESSGAALEQRSNTKETANEDYFHKHGKGNLALPNSNAEPKRKEHFSGNDWLSDALQLRQSPDRGTGSSIAA